MLASEPLCLCGVDISAPPEARGRPQTLASMQESFKQQLAPKEVSLLATCGRGCSAALSCQHQHIPADSLLSWRAAFYVCRLWLRHQGCFSCCGTM